MRGPFDGLGGAGRGRPDWRMRLLIRSRPNVHVFEVIELALESERTGAGPALHNEIMRPLETGMGEGGIAPPRVVFGADAAHHAADQPPAGDAVEHGVLFRQRKRMLSQAEGV